jgi:DNA-directed RNA polymerase
MINYILDDFISSENYETIINKEGISETKKNILYSYKADPRIQLVHRDIEILSKSIDIVIYTTFPKLFDFNSYLKKIAEICYRLSITIPWRLPTGLNIYQEYISTTSVKLKPFIFKKNTFRVNIPNRNKINKAKQIRALMPNLVHSLDAASLAMLVDSYFSTTTKEGRNTNSFFAVHDCFAVTMNNVDELTKLLK